MKDVLVEINEAVVAIQSSRIMASAPLYAFVTRAEMKSLSPVMHRAFLEQTWTEIQLEEMNALIKKHPDYKIEGSYNGVYLLVRWRQLAPALWDWDGIVTA